VKRGHPIGVMSRHPARG